MITKQEVKTFLETATMESIYNFDDAKYIQIDSVSLISSLDPVEPHSRSRHILEALLLCK